MTEPTVQRVIVLGSTGSIGTQTLRVIEHLSALAGELGVRFEVVGLAAGHDGTLLREQSARLGVSELALSRDDGRGGARVGDDAAERLVREVDADLVVAAIVGIAGLTPTLAAAELGRRVALANKESLVAAGELVMAIARRTGARLLPIDSEHAGAWQCIAALAGPDWSPPMPTPATVAHLTITASGGPFRTWDRERIEHASPEQALEHPTWRMGPKNTIDSATLVNKGLELIEAHWLFGLAPDRLDAVIHPTSIVHALVRTPGGSVIAQLSSPDMMLPIQAALTHPAIAPSPAPPIDLLACGPLAFEAIDGDRFPGVALAQRAMRAGGVAGAVLNAANEVAVRAFLEGRLPFGGIARAIESALDRVDAQADAGTLDAILDADARTRRLVEESL